MSDFPDDWQPSDTLDNGSGTSDAHNGSPPLSCLPPDLPEPPFPDFDDSATSSYIPEPFDEPIPEKIPFVKSLQQHIWADPLDLTSKIYQGLPFNVAWLPPALGDFAHDTAERMGGDPGAVVMGQILACSACADDGFYTTPKIQDLNWKERARIWALAVGPSATKKTWLFESALRAAQEIDAELTAQYIIDSEKYQFVEDQYQVEREKAVKSGGSRPERGSEKPIQEHILLNDFTMESLRPALKDSVRGIGIYRDEFAGTIKDLDRYSAKGGGDRYNMLELHNGGTKKIGRVGHFVTIRNWSAALGGCLTPSSLRSAMSELQEDGLLQRFLICMVRPSGDDIDRPADYAAKKAYESVLRTLRAQTAGSAGHSIPFAPNAVECRLEFMKTANALAKADGLPDAMAAHIRKWEAAFPRLCLLFHLVGLAVNGQHPNLNEKIDLATAEKVANFLTWQYSHVEEFWLETMGNAGGDTFAQKIAGHILAHGVTQLSHTKHVTEPYFKAWKALKPAEQQSAYATLENAGWIVRDNTAKQGIDKVWLHWHVNPAVHTKFVRQAAAERERRAAFRAAKMERRAATKARE